MKGTSSNESWAKTVKGPEWFVTGFLVRSIYFWNPAMYERLILAQTDNKFSKYREL